jgi:phospholipid/cholesterol/gamma-HCH transport system substrate-binding protein
MKFRKEASIGFIIIVALALFYWGINFLKGRNIFTTSTQYYAVYSNIGGLQKSSVVTASGYTVGTVTDIEFHRGNINKIVVEISIDRKFKIPSNSIIEIYSTDFMGSKAVNLILGDAETFAKQNDTLKSKFEGDINTLVSKKFLPLKDKAENLIVSTDSVMNIIRNTFTKETQQDLQSSIHALREIITLQKSKISLIVDNFESISENLEKSNKSFTHVVNNLSTITDSLKEADIKLVLDKTRQSLDQANEILKKINTGKGTMGQIINNDSLYNSLDKTVKDLDTLLLDLQEHPKRYVHFSIFGKKESKTNKVK